MEFIPFIWLVLSLGLPSAMGAGGSVMGMAPPQYNIARACFCVAAMFAAGITIMFGLTVPVHWIVRIVGVGLLGAATAIGLVESLRWVTRNERTAEAVPKNVGKIEPLFSAKQRISRRIIQIGDSVTGFDFGGAEGVPLFRFAADSELTIELIDGALKVSTRLKDQSAALVAELNRNEWRVAPPPRTWDRNYTQDALEVINPQGRVALQVKVLANRIQLQGEWWSDSTHGMRLVKSPDGNTGQIVIFGTNARPENTTQIVRMFVYPSEFHLGELRK
jgi:hypothetical protein